MQLRRSRAPFSQSGAVLIAMMMALVLVAAITLMLSTESAMQADRTGRGMQVQQVDYLAQAALQHALWQNETNVCRGDFSIPTTSIGPHNYAAFSTGGGTTTIHKLFADQDAWVRSDNPDDNNSGGTQHIRYETGITERALYRFDLASLPSGARIHSASAWFFVPAGQSHAEGPVTVHRVTADWLEADVTWNSFNSSFENAALGMIAPQDTGGVWVSLNVTTQVQAWVNGQPNYGVLLGSRSEGVHVQYESSEAGASERPYLEVVVGASPASPVSIIATGTLDNGLSRTLSRSQISALQPVNVAVLQLGTDAGEDAMLDAFYGARNYGGANYLQVHDNGTDWQQYPLLRFDLAALPPAASVRSARLEMNLQSLNAPGMATVHQVSRSWVEGTQSGGGQADGATWFTYDGTNAWTSAGGDYDALAVAETVIGGGETWVSWEIAPLVERWLAGQPNYGLMIRPDSALAQAKFASREDSDATVRPRLTIEYACECGTSCVAPRGSGDVLMVVVNPTTMVPADAKKKALFESWGYTVNVISESANAAAYASDAVNNDVVFISETVNSNQVGNKLVDLSIGVVSQDGAYNSDLGFAGGSSWPVSSALNVSDASHYITAIFPTGPLDIYSGPMEQLVISGGAAAGLTTLADTGGAGSLVALEAGAALLGGGIAAGRRVMLPLGRGSSFNWDYLNNSGRLIVQRAIAWGMGADTGTPIGNVLLVVVDSSSLTAQENTKKALMESWGFTVNLIDESASQGEFDDATAANDVAYVAEEIATGQLGTKLREATSGVVIEEEKITDEFGISSGETTFIEASIEVTDNTHYITQPFSLGAVAFSSSAQPVGGRAGTLAPGLEVLALRPSSTTSMLDVIDTGGVLFDTGTAAGRRVKLPWGGNDFDINSLTADGRTLMRRSIEWAAGGGGGESGYYLDDFPDFTCGGADEYRGSNGTLDWSPLEWQEILDDNSACSGDIQIIVDAGSNRLQLRGNGSGIDRRVDLSASASATLSFDYMQQGSFDATRYLSTWVSADAGGSWIELGRIDAAGIGIYESAAYDISAYAGQDTMIRFLAADLQATRRIYIDNVRIDQASSGGEGNRLLYVVKDPSSLSFQEAYREKYITDWGFTVSLIDDDATQAKFNTEIAGNDVAYVSQEVLPGSLDTKLVNATIGIVNESRDLIDEFGFAPSASLGSGAPAMTVDTSHYIASVFANPFYGYDGAIEWYQIVGLGVAPGVQAVGSWVDAPYAGRPALMALEAGAETIGGRTAAGRRVQIPMGSGQGATPVDFNSLTNDGRDIIKRSIEWAAGADGGGGGGGESPGPAGIVFEEFTDAGLGSNGTSLDIAKPGGTAAGDLLIAAIMTDGEQKPEMTVPAGWTLVDHGDESKQVSMDVFWKIAGAAEASSYAFSWAKSEEAYGFIMRFTGHDAGNPIDDFTSDSNQASAPFSPAVVATSPGALILRIGGFDDDDITVGDPGLSGHAAIAMGASGTGPSTVSGGAGYVIQAAAGGSGTSQFSLTSSEEYRAVTIAIKPQ